MPRTRRALTAFDVREAADRGAREITLPDRAIVTALARETARDLGVRLTPPTGAPAAPSGALEARVRELVTTMLDGGPGQRAGPGHAAGSTADPSPAAPGPDDARPPGGAAPRVRRVDGHAVRLAPFPYPGPAPTQQVRAADVVTAADGAPMAAGFLTLTAGSFPWTLTYDEVQYVIEGELHIGTAEGTVVGLPGDVLYVPKGTSITFGTPSWAKFLYVTYPVDWEARL